VKKSFSLIEVVIAVSILSVVMVSLLQIKSDNIFLISKTNDQSKLNDYIQLAVDFKKINQENQENEEIFLDKKFTFENDDIRKELKDIKVKIREEKENASKIDTDSQSLNITTYSRVYSIDNSIKKKIYNFKIEL
jgi:type II secretory pathway pseudopilin PulG